MAVVPRVPRKRTTAQAGAKGKVSKVSSNIPNVFHMYMIFFYLFLIPGVYVKMTHLLNKSEEGLSDAVPATFGKAWSLDP